MVMGTDVGLTGESIASANASSAQQSNAKKAPVAKPPEVSQAADVEVAENLETRSRDVAKVKETAKIAAEQSFSVDQMKDTVEKLKAALPDKASSLDFRVDEVLNRPVVSVIDAKSGEVVRQLPSHEVVRAAHNIEIMRGILFDENS